MRHERHWTLAQARLARPWVAERVETLRRSVQVLDSPPVRAALARLDETEGGGYAGHAAARAAVDLHLALSQLETAEVVVRDIDRGLVDFPALREGEEVYLCWLAGSEEEIEYWHDLDAGIGGRQPL